MFTTNLTLPEVEELIHRAVVRAIRSISNTQTSRNNITHFNEVCLYNVEEAAGLIRRKKNTLYALVSRGKIDSVKRGRELLFTEDALDSYINSVTKLNSTDKGAASHA